MLLYFTKIDFSAFQPPMYFFYVILFYKDISQLSQPPPSTPWFVMLTWFVMLGTDSLSFVFLRYLNSNHLSLFQVLACACDVFLNFPSSNHLSLSDTSSFAKLARFCHADTVCHTWHGLA